MHALVHDSLIHHVRNLVDHNAGPPLTELFEVRLRAHDNASAPRAVSLMNSVDAEDDPPCRKIGRGHEVNQLVDRAVGMRERVKAGVDRLAQIVRRNVRGHADRNA